MNAHQRRVRLRELQRIICCRARVRLYGSPKFTEGRIVEIDSRRLCSVAFKPDGGKPGVRRVGLQHLQVQR